MGYEPGAAGSSLSHYLGRDCLKVRPKPRKAEMRDRERERFVMTLFEFLELTVPETISTSKLPRSVKQ